MNSVGNFLSITLSSLVPILITAVGGMFAERARATNIALDGCMLVAALAALTAGAKLHDPWIGLAAGILAGVLYSGLLAFAAFVLRCDLIIAGIAANLLATGLTLVVVQNVLDSPGTYSPLHTHVIPKITFGPLNHIAILGNALVSQSALLYIAIVLAVVAAVVMDRTRFGVHVKAVGESEDAAQATGINPIRIRTIALLLSGAGAGVGGSYLSLSSVAAFNSNVTGGIGFIAFAAVIFGRATPGGTVAASLLFALATAASIQLQSNGALDPDLLQTLPYVATIIALALQAVRNRRRDRFDASETSYLPAIIPRD